MNRFGAMFSILVAASCSGDDGGPQCDVAPLDVSVPVATTAMPLLDRGCIDAVACAAVGEFVDADPNRPGIQYDCEASDTQRLGQPDQQEQVLPACNASASNAPCWQVRSGSADCSTGEHAALEIVRVTGAPQDNQVAAYCSAVCRSCAP
jgi:hypothetical protein